MRHTLLMLGTVGLVAATLTTGAIASIFTTTATVTGPTGMSMTLPGNPSFSDTLDGTDQTVSYSAVLAIVDARGTGAGWNLQIAATSFDDALGHTLAPGAVAAASASCVGGSSCSAATNAIGYPITVTGVATKFYDAAAATGMGKINVTPVVNVTIPGNAFIGTYTSNVTVAIVSGP
jgi:WxL domain surface cell wall-binding